MAGKALTVRITPGAHRTLRQLASESGESMPTVLDRAIEEYRRKLFLEGLASDFAALRSDTAAWDEEKEERSLWEQTVADGLETS